MPEKRSVAIIVAIIGALGLVAAAAVALFGGGANEGLKITCGARSYCGNTIFDGGKVPNGNINQGGVQGADPAESPAADPFAGDGLVTLQVGDYQYRVVEVQMMAGSPVDLSLITHENIPSGAEGVLFELEGPATQQLTSYGVSNPFDVAFLSDGYEFLSWNHASPCAAAQATACPSLVQAGEVFQKVLILGVDAYVNLPLGGYFYPVG